MDSERNRIRRDAAVDYRFAVPAWRFVESRAVPDKSSGLDAGRDGPGIDALLSRRASEAQRGSERR